MRPCLTFHRVQGHPGGGMQGGHTPCPPEGLTVERCLKEYVSERGQRAVCALTNPLGWQSER